ncbi:MAG: holo-ACP synthase [Candidatus Aureabacteria bacterium]|nr:holo-ACP synthase [Candidatus Auribacterota bacterium]NLW95025.1 holo-ACP synthase [Chlamydiota bacterium]HOE26385.1 holo-ACP synthase [bacterium]HQM53805.1 holo-ACP synthase [bacterium]
MSRACSAERGGTPGRPVPLSVGADIVEIGSMARLLRHGTPRLRRVFTPAELSARGGPASVRRDLRLACAFAGKEAVFKALGRGWGQGPRWREVSVVRTPGGRWEVRLSGGAERRRREMGASSIELSVAKTRGHAVACAILYG